MASADRHHGPGRSLGVAVALLAAALAFPTPVLQPGLSQGALDPLRSGPRAAVQPRVVEVPSRPAFVRPPGTPEQPARAGQALPARSLLRTQRPGRLQVQLADGRGFRLGGDALLRLSDDALRLERGEIIAWLTPGSRASGPLRVQTRAGTASIQGTTLFIEAGPERVRVLSWEGRVRVDPGDGQPPFHLNGAETAVWDGRTWGPPTRLSPEEARIRRRRSPLLNGFTAPMETLPLVDRTLQGLGAGGSAAQPSGPGR